MQKNTNIYMNKKGFTFIEVIIIFTIIFIMTAVLMSSSYGERTTKEITTVASEVVASLRETQNNSLTGKQKANSKLPCAFKFGLVGSDGNSLAKYNAYQMFYSGRILDEGCPPDDNTGVNTPFFDAIKLPVSMKIWATAIDTNSNTLRKDHIIFKVPYGTFVIKDDSSDTEEYNGIDIVIEKKSKKYHICVHETGLIEELGFNDADSACVF